MGGREGEEDIDLAGSTELLCLRGWHELGFTLTSGCRGKEREKGKNENAVVRGGIFFVSISFFFFALSRVCGNMKPFFFLSK